MSRERTRDDSGAESLVWTELCAAFPDTAREAQDYGFGSRWQGLLTATRRGEADYRDWRTLLAEIVEQRGYELDFAGRAGSWPLTGSAADGYRCPGALCRRRVVASPAAGVPRCELLDRDMAHPTG